MHLIMSYQKLVCLEDDVCDGGDSQTTVCKKSHTNSFRKRFKSVIYQSSLNSNYRFAKATHSLPSSPKKNFPFFRGNTGQKGDSEEKLQEYFYDSDEGDDEETKG